MKSICTPAIRYDKTRLWILDQQKLPQKEEWLEVHSPEEMVEMIKALKVRGAPMIGLAAILSISQIIEKGATKEKIANSIEQLRKSRPTAVNLSIYMDRILTFLTEDNYATLILEEIVEIFAEDLSLCDKIADAGAILIKEGERILTYCNTGSLATAGVGTALGVIKKAHLQNKGIHVFVCETRPLLQGGRLTSWELSSCKIPYTLICDNMVGQLMSLKRIDRVIVGADRITLNGDFANKIGTYTLAVLAKYHGIPFHVAAPYTTCDQSCRSGEEILIEERKTNEVRGAFGGFGEVTWSPSEAPVYNPSFDVTPGTFVTSYILDIGNVTLFELRKAFSTDFSRVIFGGQA